MALLLASVSPSRTPPQSAQPSHRTATHTSKGWTQSSISCPNLRPILPTPQLSKLSVSSSAQPARSFSTQSVSSNPQSSNQSHTRSTVPFSQCQELFISDWTSSASTSITSRSTPNGNPTSAPISRHCQLCGEPAILSSFRQAHRHTRTMSLSQKTSCSTLSNSHRRPVYCRLQNTYCRFSMHGGCKEIVGPNKVHL